eukprot:7389413-Prymnesium_polylepis.1
MARWRAWWLAGGSPVRPGLKGVACEGRFASHLAKMDGHRVCFFSSCAPRFFANSAWLTRRCVSPLTHERGRQGATATGGAHHRSAWCISRRDGRCGWRGHALEKRSAQRAHYKPSSIRS